MCRFVGAANDADSTIYCSDSDRSRPLTISPRGKIAMLIADPRLVRVDAMWIDDQGNLLMPASRLNRTASSPVTLYRLAIGAKAVRR